MYHCTIRLSNTDAFCKKGSIPVCLFPIQQNRLWLLVKMGLIWTPHHLLSVPLPASKVRQVKSRLQRKTFIIHMPILTVIITQAISHASLCINPYFVSDDD